jgi:hypothetical protein
MGEGKVARRAQKVAVALSAAPPTRLVVTKPPLGGAVDAAVGFNDRQVAILKAASDEIIPPGAGFPAPSAVGVVEDFMPRYITPRGEEPQHFPFVAEAEFKSAVDALGQGFVDAGSDRRVEMLRAVERDNSTFFVHLRDLVYYGYYSRPAVTEAIRANLEAGRDYHGAPQPYGYAETMEDWDVSMLPRGRGRYIPTAEVKRVQVRAPEAAHPQGAPGAAALVGAKPQIGTE